MNETIDGAIDSAPPLPRVSIIVPTHIHLPFFAETLRSVVDQSWTDWELIVVDDGSPDPEAVAADASIDSRIRVIRQESGGISRSRNRGLAQARGEYVAFLDHDDVWYPEHLALNVELLAAHPEAVGAYSAFDVVEGAAKTHLRVERFAGPTTKHTVLSGGNRPGLTSLVVRLEAVHQVGAFDAAFDGADDVDLVHKLVLLGDYLYTDDVTVGYRVHANNTSRNTRAVASAGDRVLTAHLEAAYSRADSAGSADLTVARQTARNYYAGVALRDAFAALRSRDVKAAVELVRWSLRMSPKGGAAFLVSGAVRKIRGLVGRRT